MTSISLTAGQKRSIEAMIKAGTAAGAARILGVKRCTVQTNLIEARRKFNVKTSLHLCIAYLRLDDVEVTDGAIQRISKFFADNPDEELTYEDMRVKFRCTRETCRKAVRALGLATRKIARTDGRRGRPQYAFSARDAA